MWWQSINRSELNTILTHINNGRIKWSVVDKCSCLFDALNKVWGQFRPGVSDNAALANLLQAGIAKNEEKALLESQKFEQFVRLTPRVMNHQTLRESNYEPEKIDAALRKNAEDEHRQLIDAYQRFVEKLPNSEQPLIKKLAQLLYIIRSNIKHGEKTAMGPDMDKVARDEAVCAKTVPLIELIVDLVFDRPSHKLLLYGTLKPGSVNNSVLADLAGNYTDCLVEGEINQQDNLATFEWKLNGINNQMKLFVSENLPSNIERIDRFEGQKYRRILVPASSQDGSLIIANIYSTNGEQL